MALAFCLSSCEQEDNTDQLLSGLNSLEKRVEALEALQKQVDAIKALIDASANNYLITNVEEITENEAVAGYKITFSNGETITINNGKDGESGATPEISVTTDTDGKLYWKVNGEWLMNGTEKVPAEGVTPQFKIEDNQWKVSYDGGTSWENVVGGGILGGTGTTVTVDDTKDDYYIFSIGDQTIQIQKYKPLEITFDSLQPGNAVIEVGDAENSKEISYSISLGGIANGVTPIIMAFADSKYTVAIDESNKKITVSTTETNLIGAEVTVLVSDGGQRTIMRSIKFVAEGQGTSLEVPNYSESSPLNITAEAKTYEITVNSDFSKDEIKASISEGVTWVSVADDSDISRVVQEYKLKLNVDANSEATSRDATVTLTAGTFRVEFKIVQAAKEVSDPYTFTIEIPASTAQNGLKTVIEKAIEQQDISNITTLIINGDYAITTTDQTYLNALFTVGGTFANVKTLDISGTKTQYIGYSGNAFIGAQFEEIKLPQTITKIGSSAFKESKLVRIEIPSSVSFISHDAFGKCTDLQEVVFLGCNTNLKDNDATLSKRVFNSCSALKSIKIMAGIEGGSLPSIGYLGDENANFRNIASDCVLYVPTSDVTSYQADNTGWASVFTGDRIQAITE